MNQLESEWLEIGEIVSVKGLKGELKVNSTTDFPERFEQPGKRWVQSKNQHNPKPVTLLKAYQIPGKNLYIVQLAEIENREKAEDLIGGKLLVEKSDRPLLEADEYHVLDLMNLEVYHQVTGENIGVVIDIFTTGHDILEIKLHKQPLIEEKPRQDASEVSRISKKRKFKPKKIQPKTVLIPFVKEIVPVVNLTQKRLEINPPRGLLEINDSESNQIENETLST